MNKHHIYSIFIFLVVFTINIKSSGQSITPFVINNGGGYATNMEWSIGESVSIANFISVGYSLNTGVLQPMTSGEMNNNDLGPIVFGHQISIGPNPTTTKFHLFAKFNEPGALSFQMLDTKSSNLLTQQEGTIFGSFEKDISMEHLPSGVYYIKIYFKPINGKTKTGIFKIIKL